MARLEVKQVAETQSQSPMEQRIGGGFPEQPELRRQVQVIATGTDGVTRVDYVTPMDTGPRVGDTINVVIIPEPTLGAPVASSEDSENYHTP